MSYQFPSVGHSIAFPHLSALDGAGSVGLLYFMRAPDRDYGSHISQTNGAYTIGLIAGFDAGIGALRLLILNTDTGYRTSASGLVDWENPSVWHMYAMFWGGNGSGAPVKFWRDTTLISTNTGPGDMLAATIGTNTADLVIGGVDDSGYSDVYLAEPAIWPGISSANFDTIVANVGALASPMAQATTPAFYARLKDNAVAIVGGTGTVTGATLQAADHPAVADPPSGATPTRNRVCIVL